MEITKEYMFRCFRNELDAREKAVLDAWVGESEDNARLYREALVEFEYLVVNGDLDAIKGKAPASLSGKTSGLKKVLKAAAGIAAAAAIFFIAMWISDYRTEREISDNLIASAAVPGQISSITLGDGTSIQLNSGSVIRYPAVFKGRKRIVELEGEAYFEVSRDSRRPFIVKTYASDIEVLGTRFNVNADSKRDIFSVTLAEGCVKVSSLSDPDDTVIMKPDEKVYMSGGRLTRTTTKAKDEIRWKDGIIDISGMDFWELVEKLELSFGVDIVIDRETMPELEFTDGRLRISDGIEYALKVLQNGSDFTWTKDFRTGTIYIR